MLLGEHTHAFDEKGRISLPSKWRKTLGQKLVITPGFDGCLFIFTKEEWERMSGKIRENSSFLSSDVRGFTRYMFGGASELEVDKAGRVLIPDFLRKRSDLGEKGVLVGVESRAEVWNEENWKVYKQKVETEAGGLAEKLSGIGIM